MPRGEGEAAAEAINSLVTPKDEPSEAAATASRLLSASNWITSEAGTSTRGEFVASTIDVDAIKRSPERFETNRKEPLMTIPENWATIDEQITSKKSEEEDSDSDSNSESSASSSGSDECSSCSTCSDSDEDSDSDSTCSSVNSKRKSFNKSRFIVESRSVVVKKGDELVQKGSVSQAETLVKSKQLINKKVNSKNSFTARKFFKRKQQLQQTTVSNGPNYRQHQQSHHQHSQQPTQAVQPASGSCVMERLSAVSTLHSEAAEVAENSNEVAQIDHFAEHFMGTSSSSKTPENANSDHTFHPLPTEGLQVIEDEDLVAILKDVSGDTFPEDRSPEYSECDRRLRNLDLIVNDEAKSSVKKVRSTADVVTEAIQRFDTSMQTSNSTSSMSLTTSPLKSANKSDLSSNKSKCQTLVNQQRQRHSSTKKSKKNKSSYTPILPAPDIDLYLNSNSNVSPDSGIQSEGTGGMTNSSPPQLLQSGTSSGSAEIVPTPSFQFSPGSTVYTQWPPQNGYYPSITADWTMTTNSGYILSNSGTALIVTSLQPPEVSPAEVPILTPAVQTTSSPPTMSNTLPFIPSSCSEVGRESKPTTKRGRGRPKGSKNKKKKVTMECGSQTETSCLESKMSSVSSSPSSVMDEDPDEDQLPPPPMFMGGPVDDVRGRPRKDPPRLEPQVEPPPLSPCVDEEDKNVILLDSEDDDHSTIMFSDGEDIDEEPPKLDLPKEIPPVLSKPPEIASKAKKKKKKKDKGSDTETALPPTLSKPKKKKKKRSKERSQEMSPPRLEPIAIQCESTEFEEVAVKISPVLSPEKEPESLEEETEEQSKDFEFVATASEPSPSRVSTPYIPEEIPSTTPEAPDSETASVDKEPFSFAELKPIFGAKYRTLKVDKFWRNKKKAKKISNNLPASHLANKKAQLEMVPKVTTKAAVKEIVNVPLMSTSTTPSTKTMLAVLKSTSIRSKPGRKKKGKLSTNSNSKRKEQQDPSSDRDADSVSSKSPAFSPRSVTSSNDENESRKKSKQIKKQSLIEMGWRTKHKNVVDPLFLGMLETVMQNMTTMQVDAKAMPRDIWSDRPSTSLPSIFRRKKIILNTSSKATFEKKRGRPKKTEKDAEHRLPLKKRHIKQQSESEAVNNVKRVDKSDKKSSGRSSRKNSTDEQRRPNANKKHVDQDKYLPQGTGQSPVKNVNIVDTIAACVDKYTNSKKDFTQPLTVVTSEPKESRVENVKASLGSPRKRHLLQMQNQCDLAPPTLEKLGENQSTKSKPSKDVFEKPDEKRPSSPPKLSRFDEKPAEQLMSPISEDERPNVYRPKVSDISEDDASDLDKAISPKVIMPICKPRIMKQTAAIKNGVMNCSVRLTKVASPKPRKPESPVESIKLKIKTKINDALNSQQVPTLQPETSSVPSPPPPALPSPVNGVADELEKPPELSKAEESNSEKTEGKESSTKNLEKRRKKKRKANRTGFPAVKKKKKIIEQKEVEKKPVKKSRKAKSTKKVVQQPVRVSARIIAEKSDTDSRPGSRIDTVKRVLSPERNIPTPEAPPIKRSKLYEDVDENIDCLGLLPLNDMEEDHLDSASAQDESNGNPNPRRKKKGIHLFKKNYLIAGLFSNFYKENQFSIQANAPIPINRVVYNPEEHIHGLLPPPYYCGRQLRQKKDDFALPYDLWWQHVNKQLPGRDVVPTWNYKPIKSNVYFDVPKINAKSYDMQACPCKTPCSDKETGCGEDCYNRMTYNECDTELCSLPEDRCANRRIQKQRSTNINNDLERFMTEAKGWGIKTKIPIECGGFIMEYVGEVVSEKEFKLRMLTEYIEDTHHYCLHLDGGTVIDGHRMGNECRFVNHSCEPNCEMQKWNVNGSYRMALFALRHIEPNEELTYDYNFSLFNPHEGQRCRCGSAQCRGVIGGKTQRINGKLDSISGNHKRKNQDIVKTKRPNPEAMSLMAPFKPLSQQQKTYVQEHHCFLLRNYEKVRVIREAFHSMQTTSSKDETPTTNGNSVNNLQSEEMILTGITALATARSMQTRRLAIAQDDPKVNKVVKVAQILKEIFSQVVQIAESKFFKEVPSRKQFPSYYVNIDDPIDLSSIEKTINSGNYTDPDLFDRDFLRLFQNNYRFYGHNSPQGQAALQMRKSYFKIKTEFLEELTNAVGEDSSLVQFRKGQEVLPGNPEDVIDCPCGQFKEEGTMIQCEKCQIWQHLDCIEPPEDPDSPYFCSKCSGIPPKLDIKLVPQPEHYPGDTDYVSLMRDDMQVRLGDTVYVLRAIKDNEASETVDNNDNNKDKSFDLGGIKHKMMSPVKGPSEEASNLTKNNYPSYKSVTNPDTQDMDIFHVERLWINEKGERFAFGYHYLRPNETFHEPTRKFFPNEVFRIPIYEVLPLDTIWRQCWVMDLPTYCKGRPIGAVEEHVYICEFRVDKKARLFDKIPKSSSKSNSKSKFPLICTKWFAFDTFDIKLKPVRNFAPHEVPEKWKTSGPNSSKAISKNNLESIENQSTKMTTVNAKKPSLKMKSREKLEITLQRLLNQLPNCDQPLDAASDLLQKRPKRKMNHNNNA